MSIYFEYPAINDYPNQVYSVKTDEINVKNINNEDSINREEINDLKDFLALKPV